MDGKVRVKECVVEGCYNIRKHINGSKYAKTCLFHTTEGEGNE